MARKTKGETLITIKTVRVEGEIMAYGSKSMLHRKLTCYTGPNGVLYYADGQLPPLVSLKRGLGNKPSCGRS